MPLPARLPSSFYKVMDAHSRLDCYWNMSNSLTRRTTLGLFPLVLGVLLRHYYSKLVKDRRKREECVAVPLRNKELMYDEVFSIMRNFMDASTSHSVEEMQKLSQLHTPIPPSAHVIRLSVPLSCCEDAAHVIIDLFGGERETTRILGGVRWWQARAGDQGVDAEWIMEKKDWQQQQPHKSARQETTAASPVHGGYGSPTDSPGLSPLGDHGLGGDGMDYVTANAYQREMDEMRCLLWAHGGGYFFGSVDQERYMIQRYARKIRGRVLAPNFRLAPQYPFPCALQDLLASYLFLIRPPEGAAHRPVQPGNIVVGGDSAGGGLAIALLQVIRDAGLPQPAGAVLVSPWCDLFHSFPSIFLNTNTDIVPATGLTVFKPSQIWPPPAPPGDMGSSIHGIVKPEPSSEAKAPASTANRRDIQPKFELESETPAASEELDQTIRVEGMDGNSFEFARQIQLYTTNALLKHPLVSPILAYLGGLPPLFVIASDREVLRDEIIYTAHRASNPAKYPVLDEVKRLYPALAGVEGRMKPTAVHLQVYDDAAHVLPLAFMATTPAKYCYRAIATFIKHVTNMPPTATLQQHKQPQASTVTLEETVVSPDVSSPLEGGGPSQAKERSPSRSESLSRKMSSFRQKNDTNEDIQFAGDPIVYSGGWGHHQGMIRERISISGTIRPLEPEHDLPALQISPELLGTVSERWVQRYIASAELHEKKYAKRIKDLAKRRERAIGNLQHVRVSQEDSAGLRGQRMKMTGKRKGKGKNMGGLLAWALELDDERPPPSSLVARRDISF